MIQQALGYRHYSNVHEEFSTTALSGSSSLVVYPFTTVNNKGQTQNYAAEEISTMKSLNKNSPSALDFESVCKKALWVCRGQASPQPGRSLRVCPANPRGLTLGNRRLLQKYQPVAPTEIQLSSSLALVPINSSSLQASRKRNVCTSPAYKLTIPHEGTKSPLLAPTRCPSTIKAFSTFAATRVWPVARTSTAAHLAHAHPTAN